MGGKISTLFLAVGKLECFLSTHSFFCSFINPMAIYCMFCSVPVAVLGRCLGKSSL